MEIFQLLKNSIDGEVISCEEVAFKDELGKVWNGKLSKSNPLAFVKVKSIGDVTKTLVFCATNKVDY